MTSTLDTATFTVKAAGAQPGRHALAVNVTPAGAGTVSYAPSMPEEGYPAGAEVTLTALPNQGYSFSGWSGDVTGSAASVTVTMDGDKTVAATFVESGGGSGDTLGQLLPLMLVAMMTGLIGPLTEGLS